MKNTDPKNRKASNQRMDEACTLSAQRILAGGLFRPGSRWTHGRDKSASLRFLQERKRRRQPTADTSAPGFIGWLLGKMGKK